MSFNMQSADPDVFFQDQGLSVTIGATYDQLIKESPTGATEPDLATKWSVSPNGLDITMQFRHGVKFHDGTPFNSSAVAFDVKRDYAMNSGPAVNIAGIKTVETPSPYTVVFVLKHRDNDFIWELAGPWGLLPVSPTAVKKHATASDPWAQKWMSDHDAGTGPYELTSYSPSGYTLQRFNGYWGKPAYYKTVIIKVVPDFTSQVLALETGQINFMIKGVPRQQLPSLESKGFKVWKLPNDNRVTMFVNPSVPAFSTTAGRLDIAAAINRAEDVSSVYGPYAALATQMFPAHSIPAGTGLDTVKYDPSVAQRFVASLPASEKNISLQYINDDPSNQPLALLIQSQLDAIGLHVTVTAVSQAQTFSYPTEPKARPDLLIVDATSRADFYAFSYPYSFFMKGAPLNYFQPPQTTAADALMNDGLVAASPATATSDYERAADLYDQTGDFIPLADQPEVLVAQSGLTGFQHEFIALNSVELALIHPVGK
jgi:peptide/nickel transport system substrate-binding protein